MALLLGLGCALLYRAIASGRPREKRFAVAALLWLAFLDLSTYYSTASHADMGVTMTRIWRGTAPSPEQQAALRRPWGPPRPEEGFGAGLAEYMPISNEFWPFNTFMLPAGLTAAAADNYRAYSTNAPPVSFHEQALSLPGQDAMPDAVARDLPGFDSRLHVDGPVPTSAAPPAIGAAGFAFRWEKWGYNEFALEATAPRDGWIMVRQLHDPRWRVTIDGAQAAPLKANYIGMAVPVTAGRHVLRWSYEPPARRLYWFAAALLEAVLAVFLTLALSGPGKPRRAAPGRPSSPLPRPA
jgi:hypothetical protein